MLRGALGVVAVLAMIGGSAWAQTPLDDSCTVSVLNRNARVAPDGSWLLPNVPANFGQVRARATCVENGITLSGQSDFFIIPPNGFVDVPRILVGVIDPIPTSLVLTAPQTTLMTLGATTQVTVTASFADGSMRDVTAANTGTNYTSSNAAIATISANGLVTAIGSGTVVVSASNDGALGILRIQVVVGGDSDGDGLSDDLEIANGLDPQNPVDAEEDPDQDGLNNRDEILNYGTDIRNGDSDGDGIADGEEVVAGADGFVTSPLLADTDGDGVRDALEIQSGSDPTDAGSLNLAQALQSLEIQPTVFILTVNTIVGEASRQLTVTGHLLDGTTIDLTSTARGTNYVSSDLNVCNFGSPDGRVFASNNGVCTITATNAGFMAVASGAVQTFAPIALSTIAIPGYANNVDVSGSYAYVAAGATGLQVVNVTNPLSPQIVAAFDTPGNANDVRIVGNLAFIADGSAGLQIVDIQNPLSPTSAGSIDTPGEAQDVVVDGTRAYVADGASGVHIIDIQNLMALQILRTVDTPGTAKGVGVFGTLIAVADGSPSSAVRIIDAQDIPTASIVGNVAIPGDAKDLVVEDTLAFVAAFTGGLQIVDFTTANAPQIIGSLPTQFVPRDVEVLGRFALFAEQLFPNAVPIVDVSLATNPAFRTTLNFSPLGDYAGTGIALTSQYVYMTGESFIVGPENGTNGNTRLFIGQYLSLEDTAGIPPTVSITSPINGDTFNEGGTVTVTVDATDDVAVVGVGFFVNGLLVSTDTAAPYQFNLTVPIGATSITLGAQAIDAGDNVGVATNVVINVVPDPPPTVMITFPTTGDTLIEGEQIALSADATDNVQVDSVRFAVDSVEVSVDTSEPFSAPFTVPTGVNMITVEATATDNLGRSTTDSVTVSVIPDPLTTATGRIVDTNGDPIEGASVTCLGSSTVSDVDGTFTLVGLSTVQGDIRCTVSFVTPGGITISAIVFLAPVRGGTTSFGDITLTEGLIFSVEIGTVGAPGSGIEQAESTNQTPTSLYRVTQNGSNVLTLEGLALGIEPIGNFGGNSDLDALDVLADGSFIFSVDFSSRGVPGSAVASAGGSGLRPSNIYRSTGNGTNELYVAGVDLGIQAFTDTNVDALALLPDGSVLFSVDDGGVGAPGSALEAAGGNGLNIYRSLRNGTNTLFRTGAALGLTAGDLTGLVWDRDGTLLFTVLGGGVPPSGSATGVGPPPTPGPTDMVVLKSSGDGTNSLFLPASEMGIDSGEVDALALSPAPTTDTGGIAPLVSIVAPAPSTDVIEDDFLTVQVSVSDDVATKLVVIYVGGAPAVSLEFPGPSIRAQVIVPLGVGPLEIEAVADDIGDNSSNALVTVNVIADPKTTVVGLVVDQDGNPADGAAVTCRGVAGATIADGTFSIANVPTIRGGVSCTASFVAQNGSILTGGSFTVDPVRGGTTDVGTIVVSSSLLAFVAGTSDAELSQLIDTASAPALPAESEFIDVGGGGVILSDSFLQIGVNSLGTLGVGNIGLQFDSTGQSSYGPEIIQVGTDCDVASFQFESGGVSFNGYAGDFGSFGGVTLQEFKRASVGSVHFVRSILTIGPLRMTTVTTFGAAAKTVAISMTFENTGTDAIDNLSFARSVDFDVNVPVTGFTNSFDVFQTAIGNTVVRASEGLNQGDFFGLATTVKSPAIADGLTFCSSDPDDFSNEDPDGALGDNSATLVFSLPGSLVPGQSVMLGALNGPFIPLGGGGALD